MFDLLQYHIHYAQLTIIGTGNFRKNVFSDYFCACDF